MQREQAIKKIGKWLTEYIEEEGKLCVEMNITHKKRGLTEKNGIYLDIDIEREESAQEANDDIDP